MDSAYKTIATILANNCPNDFEKAWVEARLDEGFSEMRFWYELSSQKQQPDIPVLQKSEVDDALHALRNDMTVEGELPWSRCTFTLFPDGKFKFDVEYDD